MGIRRGNQNFIGGIKDGLVLYLDAANSLVSGSYGYAGDGVNLNSVIGSPATLYNNPSYSSSFSGGCINFNGSNQYLLNNSNLDGNFSSKAVSFSIWFYPTSQGQIVSELGQNSINTSWHDAQIEIYNNGTNSGSFSFITWGGNYALDYVRSTALPYNKWYFLTLTHDGNTLTGYLNGVSLGTKNYTRVTPYENGLKLYYAICASDFTNTIGVSAYAGGSLGNFSLYNRALSSSEVVSLYSGSKGRFGL